MDTLLSRDKFVSHDGKPSFSSLLWEGNYHPDAPLSMTGHEGRINLRELWMAHCINDPTEYSLAMVLFGDWTAYERFVTNKRNVAHIEQLRRESTVARKSAAFRTLITDATSDSRSATASAKYLLEEPWLKGNRDGRKARQAVRDTANEAFHSTGIADDVQRLKDEGLLN